MRTDNAEIVMNMSLYGRITVPFTLKGARECRKAMELAALFY